MSLVERIEGAEIECVAKALCAASSQIWREGIIGLGGPYDSDLLNNHWRYKARAAIIALRAREASNG